jgi:PmbA protein
MCAPAEYALAERVGEIGAEVSDRCERWEVLAIDRSDSVIEIGSGQADAARSCHDVTVCLRVQVAGRTGAATSTHPDDIGGLVHDALISARHGPSSTWVDRPAAPVSAGLGGAGGAGGCGPETGGSLRELVAGVCGLHGSTAFDIHAAVTRTEQQVLRADPGGSLADRETFLHLSCVAEGRRNPALQLPWTGWARSCGLPAGLREWLTAASDWDGLPADVAVPDQPGILLGPAAVHTLLFPLVVGLSAATAASGRSFVAGDLGAPLLHPAVSLRDEPPPAGLEPDGTEGLSCPVADDNGVPCAPVTVVEGGVPARLYHSVRTAAEAGVPPTGHGFRGNAIRRKPLQPVAPVLNNATLHIDGAPTGSITDLIAELGSGVFIDSLLGGQQRAGLSPVTEGRIRLGFAVRHGRVVGTVRPTTVALDLRQVLGAGFTAASDRRWAVSRTWSGRLPFVLAAAGRH